MLPEEPALSLLPGKLKIPHLNFLISVVNRPYHQLPETKAGEVPAMKLSPASSAFRLAEFFAI
jgi:hypothetical protein